jgi:hypothetical protein
MTRRVFQISANPGGTFAIGDDGSVRQGHQRKSRASRWGGG